MPMIDVYAKEGTFRDRKALAKDLAAAVMRWEKVPEISLFKNNTAAFIHDLPADSLSNVSGDNNYVRVQVLTPVGVLRTFATQLAAGPTLAHRATKHALRARPRPRPLRQPLKGLA